MRRGGARAGAGRPRDLEAAALILEKALSLLERRGYEGVSLEAVAQAARVAKSTIYRHWPTKPELIAAAAMPLFPILEAPPDEGDARRELIQLLDCFRGHMSGRAGRVLRILVRESSAHEAVADIVQPAIHRRRRLVLQVLTRAVARGELRADVDQDVVADMLLGPLWVRSVITPAPMPPELMEQIVDSALGGIAVQ